MSLQRSPFRPVPSATHDWIGPPNPLSNLRPIVYHIPENETELEKRLRHLRQETEDWNHDFWTKQNVTFSKVDTDFLKDILRACHCAVNGLILILLHSGHFKHCVYKVVLLLC